MTTAPARRSRRWFRRAAVLLVSVAVAACGPVSEGWRASPVSQRVLVGEPVTLGPAIQTIVEDGRRIDGAMIPAAEITWVVTPPTGRVTGDAFVADEPGGYRLEGRFPLPYYAVGDHDSTEPVSVVLTLLVEAGSTPAPGGSAGPSPSADTALSVETPEPSEPAASPATSPTPSPSAGADPLAGTWTYRGRLVRGDGKAATWEYSPNVGLLIIDARPDGWYLEISEGTSSVSVSGANVELVRSFPGISTCTYTGVLEGDTMTGRQRCEARGSTDDAPWKATRTP